MSFHRLSLGTLLGALTLAFASSFLYGLARAQDRLWVDASINGKPVRLAFDTGATPPLMLLSKTVARLGLSFTNAPKDATVDPGHVPGGWTEPFDFRIGNMSCRYYSGVVEIPEGLHPNFDGVIGWEYVRNSIFMIDALRGQVSFLTNIPPEAANWVKFRLQTNAETLLMEVPNRRGEPSILAVDTGTDDGIKLAPLGWKDWKAVHTNQPMTFETYYMPGSGPVMAEVAWAKAFTVGPLVLTDVPATQAAETDMALGSSNYQATFGLAALKRLYFIVDRKKGVAYLHPRETPPPDYKHKQYNRLGVIFMALNQQSDDLLGHVADGSPAWEAGIRNGDVLTHIGRLDVTKWRADPNIKVNESFYRPAGTKLQLTLKRGDHVFKVDVVLRQILAPESDSPSKVPH